MKPWAYYNEIDERCVCALRQLIKEGFIPDGEVDSRSIKEVTPQDLEGFVQCHFFAGVGLWAYAGRLAGWSDDRPIWTGSCPCQPFSAAASERSRGFEDKRDLWPVWLPLIRKCCLNPIFGEQVTDNAAWIDRTLVDLEQASFAVGAFDLPALAVDSPTERIRTLFVGDPACTGWEKQWRTGAVVPKFSPIKRTSDRSFYGDYRTTGELGRVRRINSGIRLLAPRRPAELHAVRAAGNAINAQLGAAFIKAFM